MKVTGFYYVYGRGLMASIEEPLEKLSVGWMVGYDSNAWYVDEVAIARQ
jgi:hypothetical protein